MNEWAWSLTKWVLLAVPANMPATAKRGRAYACNAADCSWKGILADGLEHVSRCHLEVVPYKCLPCEYKAAMERDINRHTVKSESHKKKVEGYTGTIISYQSGIDVASHLTKLSQADSQALW